MKGPRYFFRAGGDSVHDAIDWVELRGHQIVSARLGSACSIRVHGIAEVDTPEAAADRRARWAVRDLRICLAIAESAHDQGRHWRGDVPNCPKCKGSREPQKPC